MKKFQLAGKRASKPPSEKNGARKKNFGAWNFFFGAGNFFFGARIFPSRLQDLGAGLPQKVKIPHKTLRPGCKISGPDCLKKQKSPIKHCTKGLFCAKNAWFFLYFGLQAQKPRHGNPPKSGKKKLVPPSGRHSARPACRRIRPRFRGRIKIEMNFDCPSLCHSTITMSSIRLTPPTISSGNHSNPHPSLSTALHPQSWCHRPPNRGRSPFLCPRPPTQRSRVSR